jgi:hypothetical protein
MGMAPKELSLDTLSEMQQVLGSLDSKFHIAYTPEFSALVNYSTQSEEAVQR